jgi:type II secretory pathway component PulK
MRLTPEDSTNPRSGFVLVAVIWLAGLIAVMATGFAAKVRIETLAAASAMQSLQAAYVADGLARLLAWRLAKGDSLPADGRPQACRWGDGPRARVRIQDQAGLADLNAMPAEFFAKLFKAAGAPDAEARRLSELIADFRDPDDQAQSGGDERQAYQAQGFGPKNAPFEAVTELDQLPGLSESLYRAVLPFVTVHAAQPGIDATTAPQDLRRLFGEGSQGDFKGALSPYAGAAQARAFGIDVGIVMPGGARFRRQAVAILLRQPDRPYAMVSWTQGGDWDENFPAAAPPCFPRG